MNRKLSLNFVFTFPFLLQIFVTVGLIAFFSYKTGKESTLLFANNNTPDKFQEVPAGG
jgi:hypothetical protein